MLTGPIRLDGVLLGYASRPVPVEAAWRDEGVYREYLSGRRELVEARWRLEGRFGFAALSAVDLAQLKALTDATFQLTLRTRVEGDPATWPELVILARRTSPIEETRPLGRVSMDRFVYDVEIAFEAVQPLEAIPGALEGGFNQLGPVGAIGEAPYGPYPIYDIEPWGDATLIERIETRIVDGVERQITFWDPGPEELLALVMEPDPQNALAYRLDTTGAWKLGVEKEDAAEPQS